MVPPSSPSVIFFFAVCYLPEILFLSPAGDISLKKIGPPPANSSPITVFF